MLYAACPESEVFIRGGGLGPLFLNFLDPPLQVSRSSGSGSNLGRGHCCVLCQESYSRSASLNPAVEIWIPANFTLGGNPAMD